jgi:DNA-binding transcriptional MerR regulator/methylmalonyl-CoA mutase cobalamin-binding subunit
MADQNLYPIGAVERDTGVGRDTLRVWERRYGFPNPHRNDKGERLYPEDQLRRLQRIRRLLDQGMRPGKLLPLSEDELDLIENNIAAAEDTELSDTVNGIIDAVCAADGVALEKYLNTSLQDLGMESFINEVISPLLVAVGERWASGQLQIFEEHFLTQQLIRFLNTEVSKSNAKTKKPRVLLATLPGEEHNLGLLMVAALLSSRGITTINLGSEVPMEQISHAVNRFQADTVGITFSGAYQYKNIRSHLGELRQLIPDDVDIWTGGEGVRRLRKLPAGVSKFTSLDNLPF